MQEASTIKPQIEAMVCPVHDIHPIVQVQGNQMEVICCCSVFKGECSKQIESMLNEVDISLDWSIS